MNHPLSIMIKPSSSKCNMNCDYCFYNDEAKNRTIADYGFMDNTTMQNLIQKVFEFNPQSVSFVFQGGEPTLIGIDYYKQFIALVNESNINKVPVSYSIQTNAYCLDKDLLQLLIKNNFLFGISLDGTDFVHNSFRHSLNGGNSYDEVIKNIELLESLGAQFNIVTTVTTKVAKNIQAIYSFYKSKGFNYQQYIPCIEPFTTDKTNDYSLQNEEYGDFLITLFDLWYNDLINNQYISIRYFDNLITKLITGKSESCDMQGFCSCQYVIESNGDVFPCDFYCLDEYLMGNININSINDLDNNRSELNFVENSYLCHEDCKVCNYYNLCRGGCKRYNNSDNLNCNCKSYKKFFDHSYQYFLDIAKQLKK